MLFIFPAPNPPENIKVESIGSTSITLTWQAPASLQRKYHVLCLHNDTPFKEEETETNTIVINNLSPGQQYTFQLAALLENGVRSKTKSTFVHTRECYFLFSKYFLTLCIFNNFTYI